MRKVLLFILLLGAMQMASAQKSGVQVSENDPFRFRNAVSFFGNVPLDKNLSIEQAVIQYLQQTNPHFADERSTLNLLFDKTSAGGRHLTFEQQYDGVPVFNSQVKVTLDKDGNLRMIADNSYDVSDWNISLQASAASMDGANPEIAFIEGNPSAGKVEKAQTVIAEIAGQADVYRYAEAYNSTTGSNVLYLLDKAGAIVYRHDRNAYSGIPAQATVLVFNPDPITTAQTIYAGQYKDFSDSTNASLDGQRQTKTIGVTLDSVGYELKNTRFEVTEFSAPTKQPVRSATPLFNYTRNQDGFEDVNSYYHLNIYNAYIEDLGFPDLADFFTQIDAHALNNDDNSMYSKGGGVARLFFGEGFVDDAEDADVIIHEYGHALSDHASPSSNFGGERSALDEGIGDYLATSYSRNLSTYRWEDMFTWDGHNDYWNGRTAVTGKHYPENMTGTIHQNGEMWNATLMQIWEALGRATTDKLMFQTLYGLSSGQTMSDVAMVFLQSDSLLFDGDNTCVIAQKFYDRGLFDETHVPPCVVIGIADIAKTANVSITNTDGFAFNNQPVLIENKGGNGLKQLTLTDVSGRIIIDRRNLPDNSYFIDGTALQPGIYILKVDTEEGVKTEKLVKMVE